jgi:hypothetical protein
MNKKNNVYPSEVLAAIEYAKKKDPTDKDGDGAFRFDANFRAGQFGVRYATFNILKCIEGKWTFVPLVLNFFKLQTKAKILSPHDPKRKFAGAQLQFRGNSTFTSRDGRTEEYGKAKISIVTAFVRIMKKALQDGVVFNNNEKINTTVQFTREADPTSKRRDKLAPGEEIIRVDIPFKKTKDGDSQKILDDERPTCEIADASKPTKRSGKIGLEPASVDGEPVTYLTIGKFITPGSACSGAEDMSGPSFSNMGISLPSRITAIVVARGKGFRQTISGEDGIFDEDELAALVDTSVAADEEPLNGEKEADVVRSPETLKGEVEKGTAEDLKSLTEATNDAENDGFDDDPDLDD